MDSSNGQTDAFAAANVQRFALFGMAVKTAWGLSYLFLAT